MCRITRGHRTNECTRINGTSAPSFGSMSREYRNRLDPFGNSFFCTGAVAVNAGNIAAFLFKRRGTQRLRHEVDAVESVFVGGWGGTSKECI